MECRTNPSRKRLYQCELWALFLGDLLLFALGCVVMAAGLIASSVLKSFMIFILIGLVCGLFPAGLILTSGLAASGTQRVFLTDGTLTYVTWDSDRGAGGAKYHFYQVWKVSDYQLKRWSIDVKAFVWYAEVILPPDGLPVENGQLGDISEIMENAQRAQREFTIRRTVDDENRLLSVLEERRNVAWKDPNGIHHLKNLKEGQQIVE